MNENDVESLLMGLQPRGPSAALTRQVEHELELDRQWMRAPVRQASHRWWRPAAWAVGGAAAALLVMSALDQPAPAPTTLATAAPAPPAVMPVRTIREVVSAENEGIQYNAVSRLPEQHLRLMSVERHVWIDPRDGAQITVETPREESVVLPVSFQ